MLNSCTTEYVALSAGIFLFAKEPSDVFPAFFYCNTLALLYSGQTAQLPPFVIHDFQPFTPRTHLFALLLLPPLHRTVYSYTTTCTEPSTMNVYNVHSQAGFLSTDQYTCVCHSLSLSLSTAELHCRGGRLPILYVEHRKNVLPFPRIWQVREEEGKLAHTSIPIISFRYS